MKKLMTEVQKKKNGNFLLFLATRSKLFKLKSINEIFFQFKLFFKLWKKPEFLATECFIQNFKTTMKKKHHCEDEQQEFLSFFSKTIQ